HPLPRDFHERRVPPQLGSLDRDDFAPLVEAAVRAHAMRELDLAALRAQRPRRRHHLVVGTALAPTGLGMTPLWQGHGRARFLSVCWTLGAVGGSRLPRLAGRPPPWGGPPTGGGGAPRGHP